jgi:hypothetical protein
MRAKWSTSNDFCYFRCKSDEQPLQPYAVQLPEVPFARAGSLSSEEVRIRCKITTERQVQLAREQLKVKQRILWRINAMAVVAVVLTIAGLAFVHLIPSLRAGSGLVLYTHVRTSQKKIH